MKVNPHRSSLGMDANIAALIAYIVGGIFLWVPYVKYFLIVLLPLALFILEKDSPFVKFHAMQATILNAIFAVLAIILDIIHGAILRSPAYWASLNSWASLGSTWASTLLLIFAIVFDLLAILGLYKAFTYFEFKIPVIGDFAQKLSRKNINF
jgi:uncharacterized membrane protein